MTKQTDAKDPFNVAAGERLKLARAAAGYKTATAAARAIGTNVVTYTAHENGGRGMEPKQALFYATKFGADPGRILFGDHPASPVAGTVELAVQPDNAMLFVQWLSELREGGTAPVPAAAVARTHRLVVVPVVDDGMDFGRVTGSLAIGDKVLVNLDYGEPDSSGLYAILDGSALKVRRLEIQGSADDARVRVFSDNPIYTTYECALADLRIVGRVVALISAR